MKKFVFAVIGGDKRQEYIYEILIHKGFTVYKFFLNNFESIEQQLINIEKCNTIILPIPYSSDGIYLKAPFYDNSIKLESITNHIPCGSKVFSGGVFESLSSRNDIEIFDLLKDESLVIKNAMSTAEAAVGKIISATDFTVSGSRSIILGYGRIAKYLAEYLKALNSTVTVCARRYEVRALCEADGFSAIDFGELDCLTEHADIIINTVPALVLNRQSLLKIKKTCYVIDLASAPGGIDFSAAEKLGLNVEHALSLPGKFSPQSAAKYIEQTILHNL